MRQTCRANKHMSHGGASSYDATANAQARLNEASCISLIERGSKQMRDLKRNGPETRGDGPIGSNGK